MLSSEFRIIVLQRTADDKFSQCGHSHSETCQTGYSRNLTVSLNIYGRNMQPTLRPSENSSDSASVAIMPHRFFERQPVFRQIADKGIHAICRLKNSKVRHLYKGNLRTLAELLKKIRKQFKKDKKTGLLPARITVRLPDSDEDAVIVFCKGCKEPEDDTVGGKKKGKRIRTAAFLSADTSPHSSSVIKKYAKRWATEVCHKECKQMPELGKDQSKDFNARVFATTASFMTHGEFFF